MLVSIIKGVAVTDSSYVATGGTITTSGDYKIHTYNKPYFIPGTEEVHGKIMLRKSGGVGHHYDL